MVAAGFIDESTLRCVRLRDVDDNMHVVPNDMITSVVDMSCDFAQSVVDGGVAYLEHVDETLVTMREVGTTPRATPAFGHRILEEVEVVGAECRDGTAVSLPCRFQAVPMQKRAVRLVQLRQL